MHYILKENTEEDYCEGVQNTVVDSQNYRTEAVQEEEQRTGL